MDGLGIVVIMLAFITIGIPVAIINDVRNYKKGVVKK